MLDESFILQYFLFVNKKTPPTGGVIFEMCLFFLLSNSFLFSHFNFFSFFFYNLFWFYFFFSFWLFSFFNNFCAFFF
ncbi:MAG TPA: hypothetical protein DEB09_00555 [Candidatus Magasanikbacteria bacterium]|nr:hypothetical protein [Candidatus Magasanikbacteria bacterium]